MARPRRSAGSSEHLEADRDWPASRRDRPAAALNLSEGSAPSLLRHLREQKLAELREEAEQLLERLCAR